MRHEAVPDEPGPSILDPELGSAEQGEKLGTRSRLLGGERSEAFAVRGKVSLFAQRRKLSLQFGDPALAVDPRIREVVARADEVKRRPHYCRFDDPASHDGAGELIGVETVDP